MWNQKWLLLSYADNAGHSWILAKVREKKVLGKDRGGLEGENNMCNPLLTCKLMWFSFMLMPETFTLVLMTILSHRAYTQTQAYTHIHIHAHMQSHTHTEVV